MAIYFWSFQHMHFKFTYYLTIHSWFYASGLKPLKNVVIAPNDVEKDWWDKQCSCKYDQPSCNYTTRKCILIHYEFH